VITRTEFDFLPAVEKAHTVFEFGEELDNREYEEFRIKLYMVSDFYVELWYSLKNIRISKLESLSLDEVVDFYGDDINISDAFAD
jgi:hypothetical protein